MKRLALALPVLLLVGACATQQRTPPSASTPSRPAPAPEISDGAPSAPPDLSQVPDAVPRYEPRSRYGNPSSYEVFDERYHTLDSAENFVQRGIASWYGTKFHGRRTSSGEPFDMYAMTAAHKELPLPTYLEVTNLENGRKVIVRVNDRGPFKKSRILDLSYAAASRLGVLAKGTAAVEIRAITPAPGAAKPQAVTPATVELAKFAYYIQVGAFSDPTNAERLRARVSGLGAPVRVEATGSVHRVRLGPLADVAAVDRITNALADRGISNAQVVVAD
jgi:rare lipoprotein A